MLFTKLKGENENLIRNNIKNHSMEVKGLAMMSSRAQHESKGNFSMNIYKGRQH